MKSRREFFGNVFRPPKENDESSAPASLPVEKAKVTRRTLLRRGAEAAAGAAVLKYTAEARADDGRDLEKKNEEETKRELNKLFEVVHNYVMETDRALKEITKYEQERTMREQDTYREYFIARYKQAVLDAMDQFLNIYLPLNKISDSVTQNYGGQVLRFTKLVLASVDCHGLLNAAFHKNKKQSHKRIIYTAPNYFTPAHSTFFMTDEQWHYKTRVADFFPDASDVQAEEIDPRLNTVHKFIDVDLKEDTIKTTPAWTSIERQDKFRDVISNSHVRSLLENTDCTLAEAYSLIKAAIVYREQHSKTLMDDATIMTGLLKKREEFKKEIILGPDTNTFIHFNYQQKENPKQFDGDLLDQLWQNVGAHDKPHPEGWTGLNRIDGIGDVKKTNKIFIYLLPTVKARH